MARMTTHHTSSPRRRQPREALPGLVLLATGGTIAGSAPDSSHTAGYQAGALGVDALLEAVPRLASVADIRAEPVAQIDSKDMTPSLWLRLARRVDHWLAQSDIAGAVITHGTDTLEETAYFLQLVVKRRKPVVLTAAMRPASALSADGPLNLLNAARVAAHPDTAGRGVLVVVNNQIHCARDIVKTSTYAIDALRSPDTGVLGWVQDDRIEFQRQPLRAHTVDTVFDVTDMADGDALPPVEVVTSYAGASRVPVDALVKAGARGLVAAGTGNGSLHADVQQALADAAKAGVAVVRASRTGSGHVMHNAAAPDEALGFISAGSLNPYKARVLLALALRHGLRGAALQQAFDTY